MRVLTCLTVCLLVATGCSASADPDGSPADDATIGSDTSTGGNDSTGPDAAQDTSDCDGEACGVPPDGGPVEDSGSDRDGGGNDAIADGSGPPPDGPVTTRMCDGVPVDSLGDPSNCGACGNRCAARTDGTVGVCDLGTCRVAEIVAPGGFRCDGQVVVDPYPSRGMLPPRTEPQVYLFCASSIYRWTLGDLASVEQIGPEQVTSQTPQAYDGSAYYRFGGKVGENCHPIYRSSVPDQAVIAGNGNLFTVGPNGFASVSRQEFSAQSGDCRVVRPADLIFCEGRQILAGERASNLLRDAAGYVYWLDGSSFGDGLQRVRRTSCTVTDAPIEDLFSFDNGAGDGEEQLDRFVIDGDQIFLNFARPATFPSPDGNEVQVVGARVARLSTAGGKATTVFEAKPSADVFGIGLQTVQDGWIYIAASVARALPFDAAGLNNRTYRLPLSGGPLEAVSSKGGRILGGFYYFRDFDYVEYELGPDYLRLPLPPAP